MQIRALNNRTPIVPEPGTEMIGVWEFILDEGESAPVHHHESSEELLVILEGSGVVEVANTQTPVEVGDVVGIPIGARHGLTNTGNGVLKGLLAEIHVQGHFGDLGGVTVKDLDRFVEQIPEGLDRTTSLQMIIQLFDAAGQISEQIDRAVGLDNETGCQTLESVEVRVMEAVVRIARSYELGLDSFKHPRW